MKFPLLRARRSFPRPNPFMPSTINEIYYLAKKDALPNAKHHANPKHAMCPLISSEFHEHGQNSLAHTQSFVSKKLKGETKESSVHLPVS